MQYDFVVIGSGFGGSVACLRLVEKGYRVCVIESGKRFDKPADYAKSTWNLRKFLWAPALFCYGIQRIHLLNDVLVLAGSGVGGGSLVYGNTLLEPPDSFYQDENWPDADTDWEAELSPHYQTAKKVLGVVTNPGSNEPDRLLKQYGKQIGREDLHRPTEVGVFFGEPGVTAPDPYFGGDGPSRTGCTETGHCMVGCKDGGKNSLNRNYLYLAEKKGLEIIPEHKVIDIVQHEDGSYGVTAERVTDVLHKRKRRIKSTGIILAAGALGTMNLLMRCREKGHLPNLSGKLGHVVRTNSETLCGITKRKKPTADAKGLAISSGLYVDEHTHIEVVRYPTGSDLMLCLGAGKMIDGGTKIPRALRFIWACIRHPLEFVKITWPGDKAKRSIILLVMQTLDNYLTLHRKLRWWSFFRKVLSSNNGGKPIPCYIPAGHQAARAIAKEIDAVPQNMVLESLFNIPITAHILGGCTMGKDIDHGVIDSRNRVFGYENMYVVDGSSIPANLGVNPSLTITAMSERAMHYIPKKTS
ncbi:MAG: GMC family oxidoreductase [Proteobacteria bacterium]|nr:GMC family oxidoreductase [Pseudomonadota bacterium]